MSDRSIPKPFIYLAPIRGITDALFRNVLLDHFGGIDGAVAPFINPQTTFPQEEKLLRDVLPENNPKLAVIPQLLNTDPEPFLTLAGILADRGFSHINWNLGCPAPMVAKKKRGSGLLPYPEEILRLLDKVMPRLKLDLSIKTRLGYSSRKEIATLLPQLNKYPLKEIIIHPRLGKQIYKGSADPDGFALCLELSSHSLVYNGDICSADQLKILQQRFPGVEKWMIGRGILSTPGLAEDIKESLGDDSRNHIQRLQRFHDDLYHGYQEMLSGPGHLLGRLKLIWSYLIDSFPENQKFLKKIQKSRSPEQYLSIVDELFEQSSS
jgi:tRNA-dihydrouridine synthase B